MMKKDSKEKSVTVTTVAEINAEIDRFQEKIRPMIRNAEVPYALVMCRSVKAEGAEFRTQPSVHGDRVAGIAAFTRLLSERSYHDMVGSAMRLIYEEKLKIRISPLSRKKTHAPALDNTKEEGR